MAVNDNCIHTYAFKRTMELDLFDANTCPQLCRITRNAAQLHGKWVGRVWDMRLKRGSSARNRCSTHWPDPRLYRAGPLNEKNLISYLQQRTVHMISFCYTISMIVYRLFPVQCDRIHIIGRLCVPHQINQWDKYMCYSIKAYIFHIISMLFNTWTAQSQIWVLTHIPDIKGLRAPVICGVIRSSRNEDG